MTSLSGLLQRQLDAQLRAALDPALSGAAIRIYIWLGAELNAQDYQAVKVESLANTLQVEFPTAARALRVLAAKGFIERGPKIQRLWSYRLRHYGRDVPRDTQAS